MKNVCANREFVPQEWRPRYTFDCKRGKVEDSEYNVGRFNMQINV